VYITRLNNQLTVDDKLDITILIYSCILTVTNDILVLLAMVKMPTNKYTNILVNDKNVPENVDVIWYVWKVGNGRWVEHHQSGYDNDQCLAGFDTKELAIEFAKSKKASNLYCVEWERKCCDGSNHNHKSKL
jgi:hypothetical protein